jgi:hypothetical protein
MESILSCSTSGKFNTVGIDISKDKFDVFIIRYVDGSEVTEKSISLQFHNEGSEEFTELLDP